LKNSFVGPLGKNDALGCSINVLLEIWIYLLPSATAKSGLFQHPCDVTTVTAVAPLQQGLLLLSVIEAEPNKGDDK